MSTAWSDSARVAALKQSLLNARPAAVPSPVCSEAKDEDFVAVKPLRLVRFISARVLDEERPPEMTNAGNGKNTFVRHRTAVPNICQVFAKRAFSTITLEGSFDGKDVPDQKTVRILTREDEEFFANVTYNHATQQEVLTGPVVSYTVQRNVWIDGTDGTNVQTVYRIRERQTSDEYRAQPEMKKNRHGRNFIPGHKGNRKRWDRHRRLELVQALEKTSSFLTSQQKERIVSYLDHHSTVSIPSDRGDPILFIVFLQADGSFMTWEVLSSNGATFVCKYGASIISLDTSVIRQHMKVRNFIAIVPSNIAPVDEGERLVSGEHWF